MHSRWPIYHNVHDQINTIALLARPTTLHLWMANQRPEHISAYPDKIKHKLSSQTARDLRTNSLPVHMTRRLPILGIPPDTHAHTHTHSWSLMRMPCYVMACADPGAMGGHVQGQGRVCPLIQGDFLCLLSGRCAKGCSAIFVLRALVVIEETFWCAERTYRCGFLTNPCQGPCVVHQGQ